MAVVNLPSGATSQEGDASCEERIERNGTEGGRVGPLSDSQPDQRSERPNGVFEDWYGQPDGGGEGKAASHALQGI